VADLQCVVVTPERTELKTTADMIVVPLFDGELGILKGKSPLVGRLGYGMMRIQTGNQTDSYYIGGGFVQVNKEGVFVLTDRLTKADSLDAAQAAKDLDAALAMTGTSMEAVAARDKALASARARVRLTSK
jgi:F-type H+-transporting ATPase subunit epsilon